MRRIFILVVLASLVCSAAKAAESTNLTLYVQLIRGSDQETPPTPQAKPVGPKLSERLHGIFKWKNYWEIKRDSITLKPGEKSRKTMSAERDVEIELLNPKEMAIRIYKDKKPISDSRQPVGNSFYVAGGDKEGGQSWFIVVRQTPPPEYPVKTPEVKPSEVKTN